MSYYSRNRFDVKLWGFGGTMTGEPKITLKILIKRQKNDAKNDVYRSFFVDFWYLFHLWDDPTLILSCLSQNCMKNRKNVLEQPFRLSETFFVFCFVFFGLLNMSFFSLKIVDFQHTPLLNGHNRQRSGSVVPRCTMTWWSILSQ